MEESFDAGRTWNDCRIEPPMSPYSWVIWNYTWRPPNPGKFQTVVPATDRKGQLQIAEIVRPQPACASGTCNSSKTVRELGLKPRPVHKALQNEIAWLYDQGLIRQPLAPSVLQALQSPRCA